MHTYSKPVLGLSSIRSADDVDLIREYEDALITAEYCPQVARLHLHSVVHFMIWLQRQGIALEAADDYLVTTFDRHRRHCRCPGTSRDGGRKVTCCVRVFLRYLRARGRVKIPAARPIHPTIQGFLSWMRAERGVADTTLRSYRDFVAALLDFLGDDPRKYTAGGLREFVEKRYRHWRPSSIRMVLAAVRMFLRYLAAEGRCRPGLEQALISPACWAKQALPRGLSNDEVQRILNCLPATPTGIRDRAMLLLMVRLGLRASDVAALRLEDLCFGTATVRVCGKGRREVLLPLPQDVGDAILEYLRSGRPDSRCPRLFLRVSASFPTSGRQGIGRGAARWVARSALNRAAIGRPTRGSHVLRHTAACQMLRAGVSLEGIAQVLRHRSVETTGIYAKVDVAALEQIAQPWPEVASC